MVTATHTAELRARLSESRRSGARIALVPTMGALHEGHLALVDEGRRAADLVVVSVFVNPLQFGPAEDFTRYPRTLDEDASKLAARGTWMLFAPGNDEMFPHGPGTVVVPPALSASFEGAVRPGHFAGVTTVVAKLFNIVQPDIAVFGRKDLQQLSVIRAMVRDLDFPVGIAVVDTVREDDGLALSSRNRYLDEEARRLAPRIRAALVASRAAFESGISASTDLEAVGRRELAGDSHFAVDYFNVVRESDFSQPALAQSGDSIVTAVRVGGTRLIDNIQL